MSDDRPPAGPPSTSRRASRPGAPPTEGRHLGIIGWLVLVVAYLAILQGVAALLLIGRDDAYLAVSTVDQVWRGILVPVAVSVALVFGAVRWLGWWHPVWHDDVPVRRWLVVVPVVLVVAILASTNFTALLDRGATFVLLLALSTLLVGLGEEGMFRGLGVTVFRRRGSSEVQVALWTSVLFGLSHSVNVFSEGPTALLQAFVAMLFGYLMYLIRRLSRGLLLPVLVHALWDFSLISLAIAPEGQGGALLVVAGVEILLGVVLLVRRRHISPPSATPSPTSTP